MGIVLAEQPLKNVLKLLKLSPGKIMLAVIAAFISSLCDGISLALLVPVLRGLLSSSFQTIYQLPFIGQILSEHDSFIHHNKTLVFGGLMAVIFLAGTLKAVFQYLAFIISSAEVWRGIHKMRVSIFGRLLSFGKLFFDKQNSGHLHQVLVDHTEQIGRIFIFCNVILQSGITSIFYILILIKISIPMTIFVISVFPIIQTLITKIIKKISASSSNYVKKFEELGGNISNAFSCLTLIKAYCRESEEKERFERISSEVCRHRYSIDKKNGFIGPFHEMVMISMILVLVSMVAFLLVKQGRGDIAAYLVFFVVLKRLLNNVSQISAFFGNLSSVKGQIMQIDGLMTDQGKYIIPDGKLEFSGIKKSIEIKNLSYQFPGRPVSIRNLSISFKVNQLTALVGESGAGKTTLINLLMRFYDPPSKTIFVDGVDVRDFKLSSLRANIALVDQRDLLFNTSVRYNLTFGLDREVSEDELLKAMEDAQLSKLLTSLKDGLDTEIGDRGVQLSGGEKQRLQIARAMLKKADIMIFDEATSALDSQTELLIQKAVNNLLKNKTSIVIAHRLATIQEADNILLIKDGQLIEHGSFQSLIEKEKHFYQLWSDQGMLIR